MIVTAEAEGGSARTVTMGVNGLRALLYAATAVEPPRLAPPNP